ncbi:MAG: ATP-binding cassette domain-containing protein [Paracoccaceae bacterium]
MVDDVSLRVMPGSVTCLLGPSGCGKSTTLRMIAGVEMQDLGEIFVDGNLICDTVFRAPPERRHIGLMFQDFALFPHLSVADNVAWLRWAAATRSARGSNICRGRSGCHASSTPSRTSCRGRAAAGRPSRALAPSPDHADGRAVFRPRQPPARRDLRPDAGCAETGGAPRFRWSRIRARGGDADGRRDRADAVGRIVQQGAPYGNIYNAPRDKAAVAFFSDINVIRGKVQGLSAIRRSASS